MIKLKDLEAWFINNQRVLPWRNSPTIYRVWISEIMLQQTQVVTVVPYFEKFIARFPSVEVLAKSPVDEVLLYWAGLGYYSRARNLHRGATQIVALGRFPRNREEWLEISGVGEYTAGAILSIASNEPEAILDGNVERVIARLRCVGRDKARLWRLSRQLVRTAQGLAIPPSRFNQALMELGATVCIPRNPKCEICPVAGMCKAHKKGVQEQYPEKKPRQKWITVEERVLCYLDAKDRVLLSARKEGEWRAGLWDFIEQTDGMSQPTSRNAKKVQEIETRYVVTRHRVRRITEVWQVGNSAKWGAADSVGAEGTRWVPIDNPGVALGAPARKVFKLLKDSSIE